MVLKKSEARSLLLVCLMKFSKFEMAESIDSRLGDGNGLLMRYAQLKLV